MESSWIDINEYANKYGVSTSTLRRRIRSGAIKHKLEKGKYLLPDTEDVIDSAPLFSRKFKQSAADTNPEEAPRQSLHDPVADFMNTEDMIPLEAKVELDNLRSENRKLNGKVSELEMLVKVLEAELSQKS